MKKIPNINLGHMLEEEFLKPLNISKYRLSKETDMPQTRISEIVKAKRRITVDTAIRLIKFFDTSEKFWLGLQDDNDLVNQYSISNFESINLLDYSS